MKNRTKRSLLASVAAAGVILTLAGCDTGSNTSASTAETNNENTTGQIEGAASKAVPYPLTQMEAGGWTEEQLLKEHLLRENDPNAVRYIVMMSQQGQVIAQWPIKGMVFDPNSSMTETTDMVCSNGGSDGNAYGCGTVNSPGDNGTYGNEAGAAAFFTTSGVEIQLPTSAIWVEADAPLNLTTAPVITMNANATPSSNYGGLAKIGSK